MRAARPAVPPDFTAVVSRSAASSSTGHLRDTKLATREAEALRVPDALHPAITGASVRHYSAPISARSVTFPPDASGAMFRGFSDTGSQLTSRLSEVLRSPRTHPRLGRPIGLCWMVVARTLPRQRAPAAARRARVRARSVVATFRARRREAKTCRRNDQVVIEREQREIVGRKPPGLGRVVAPGHW